VNALVRIGCHQLDRHGAGKPACCQGHAQTRARWVRGGASPKKQACTRTFRGLPGRAGGHIVNIASAIVARPQAGQAIYCATKAGQRREESQRLFELCSPD
jgi:NAD(P)-dependent dehydrogenase (short-subunit alcohol dehydrogenase family)